MNIDYTGRHVEVTPALRQFAEEKLSKLERVLDGPLDVHVVLAIEKHRHVAEIQVKSRSAVLSGAHETDDLYASIGEVVDKLERQALKHKEKLQRHKHRQSPRQPDVAAAVEANAAPLPAADAEPAAALPGRIRRGGGFRVKPLSAEDAAIELETSGAEVLVFRDLDTQKLCVLHRRSDGDLVLVEPEY